MDLTRDRGRHSDTLALRPRDGRTWLEQRDRARDERYREESSGGSAEPEHGASWAEAGEELRKLASDLDGRREKKRHG